MHANKEAIPQANATEGPDKLINKLSNRLASNQQVSKMQNTAPKPTITQLNKPQSVEGEEQFEK